MKENDMIPKSAQKNEVYIRNALDGWKQPPIDISDPAQVEERMLSYFETCANNGMRPCVSGLCNRIGIHRNTFLAWCTGRERKTTHQELALKAKSYMEELTETLMLNNDINVVAGIFLLKNHFGYTDKTELSIDTSNSIIEPKSMDEIMALADSNDAIDVDYEEIVSE